MTIEPTKKTPAIECKPEGLIHIHGRSIPEDADIFYDRLFTWINEYTRTPGPETKVVIEMEYLNSGSSKAMFNMLKDLSLLVTQGHQLVVSWVFEEGDEDIKERGEYIASILDLDFQFVETGLE